VIVDVDNGRRHDFSRSLLKVSLLIQTLVYEFSVIPGKLAVASLTRNPGDSE
jgi:hypothetical protein